jgi:IS5 family transposase
MWFCGLSFDSPSPDHVTIHRWRERFNEFGIFQEIFDDFHAQLSEKGYILKDATIVDTTLIRSAARPRNKTIVEVEKITENGVEKEKIVVESETSIDSDAKWTFKSNDWVYGFKDHQAVNSDGIILGVLTTPANVHDGRMLPEILDKIKPPKKTRVYADKAYDSTKNREYLSEHKLKDGLMRKKEKNRAPSNRLVKFNKMISGVRFVVE